MGLTPLSGPTFGTSAVMTTDWLTAQRLLSRADES